jgi:CcmD family protein
MNFLLEPGIAIYIAMATALLVWLLVFAYLLRIDRQTRELRRRLDQEQPSEARAPQVTIEHRPTLERR